MSFSVDEPASLINPAEIRGIIVANMMLSQTFILSNMQSLLENIFYKIINCFYIILEPCSSCKGQLSGILTLTTAEFQSSISISGSLRVLAHLLRPEHSLLYKLSCVCTVRTGFKAEFRISQRSWHIWTLQLKLNSKIISHQSLTVVNKDWERFISDKVVKSVGFRKADATSAVDLSQLRRLEIKSKRCREANASVQQVIKYSLQSLSVLM